MTLIDWDPLKRELELWQIEDRFLPLWCRDDDAVADTPALRRLMHLAHQYDLPVHLAVIPDLVQPALVEVACDRPYLIPIQHGFRHDSHAPNGEKKAEFGAHRPLTQMIQDIETGTEQIRMLFGQVARPMFVPPWNRISPGLMCHLADLGFASVSTHGPRKDRVAAPGLVQINTHIDPINWHRDRDLVAPDHLIETVVQHLQARRQGRSDDQEPLGLLTHHLVHSPAVWDWAAGLLDILLSTVAIPWVHPSEIEDLP
ncbi:MAG: polysaccharide deacetylase family protein [Rhodobacteraceae bacterium]|nr:polysaccharide deacetylase family protein [Paracoccaceae bacterium]